MLPDGAGRDLAGFSKRSAGYRGVAGQFALGSTDSPSVGARSLREDELSPGIQADGDA